MSCCFCDWDCSKTVGKQTYEDPGRWRKHLRRSTTGGFSVSAVLRPGRNPCCQFLITRHHASLQAGDLGSGTDVSNNCLFSADDWTSEIRWCCNSRSWFLYCLFLLCSSFHPSSHPDIFILPPTPPSPCPRLYHFSSFSTGASPTWRSGDRLQKPSPRQHLMVCGSCQEEEEEGNASYACGWGGSDKQILFSAELTRELCFMLTQNWCE